MSGENKSASAARDLLAHHSVLGTHEDGVAALLERGEKSLVGDGRLLCEEGKTGNSLYFLIEGQVRVTKDGTDEYCQTLATLQAPAILGHVSLIDGSPRSASCVVYGSARVVRLEKSIYDELLGEKSIAGTTLRRMLISSQRRSPLNVSGAKSSSSVKRPSATSTSRSNVSPNWLASTGPSKRAAANSRCPVTGPLTSRNSP